jgi:hypothetical protein
MHHLFKTENPLPLNPPQSAPFGRAFPKTSGPSPSARAGASRPRDAVTASPAKGSTFVTNTRFGADQLLGIFWSFHATGY